MKMKMYVMTKLKPPVGDVKGTVDMLEDENVVEIVKAETKPALMLKRYAQRRYVSTYVYDTGFFRHEVTWTF